MHLRLLAVGTRRPVWERDGFAEYARRLPRPWALELVEIPPARRGRAADPARARREEGERILGRLGEGERLVALDEAGEGLRTADLARRLGRFAETGGRVTLAIGGADGLWEPCLERAEARWSLSPLTLPHGLELLP